MTPTARAAHPKAKRSFLAPRERLVEMLATPCCEPLSRLATDLRADLTAFSLTALAFSARGEDTRLFSMVAERGR